MIDLLFATVIQRGAMAPCGLHDAAELVSLGLTLVAIAIGLWVICEFHRPAWAALTKPKRTAMDWLIAGIYVGFVGGCLDSMYWGAVWVANYFQWEHTYKAMQWGVVPNIVFRNLCDIASAYLHIRGVAEHYQEPRKIDLMHHRLCQLFLAGTIFAMALRMASVAVGVR